MGGVLTSRPTDNETARLEYKRLYHGLTAAELDLLGISGQDVGLNPPKEPAPFTIRTFMGKRGVRPTVLDGLLRDGTMFLGEEAYGAPVLFENTQDVVKLCNSLLDSIQFISEIRPRSAPYFEQVQDKLVRGKYDQAADMVRSFQKSMSLKGHTLIATEADTLVSYIVTLSTY